MSKWLLTLAGMLLIFCGGCCCSDRDECREGLSECKEELAEYRETCGPLEECPASPETAFKLVLKADTYGTFLPVNNQYECPPEADDLDDAFPNKPEWCRKPQSGFLVQLTNFPLSNHSYDLATLTFADGDTEPLWRDDFKWIDIRCEQSFQEVLTPAMAAKLVPQAAGDGRLLHHGMSPDPEQTNLVTIWQGDEGLSVGISRDPEFWPEEDHLHDIFTFRSGEPCKVLVYDEMGDPAVATEYPVDTAATRVVEIVIEEELIDAPHGGVHHPPWI